MQLHSIALVAAILWKYWPERGEAAAKHKSFDDIVESSSLSVDAFVLTHEISLRQSTQTSDIGIFQFCNENDEMNDFRAETEHHGKQPQQSLKSIDTSNTRVLNKTSYVEKGTIIPSQPIPKFGGGLLRHPFWHKAVMLILEHEESETLGVFLNRPTDLILREDGISWNVWYGGPVHCGVTFADSDTAELLCLHSLSSAAAMRCSKKVAGDVYYTKFKDAKKLVEDGIAAVDDFLVFAGYCGWCEGQLQRELNEESWIAITPDSSIILDELIDQKRRATQQIEHMVQDAGMEIWSSFASRIDHCIIDDKSSYYQTTLHDLLLKEWARDNLSYHREKNAHTFTSNPDVQIKPGTLLRARTSPRSPFLLSDQDMHKSIILVVSENLYGTVGVILNLPTTKTVDLDTSSVRHLNSTTALLMRYGGNYVVFGEGERSLLWLHCNDALRKFSVGIPFDEFNTQGVWECTADDVASSIRDGKAAAQNFMVVSGGYIWVKDNNGQTGGMRGEVWDGKFEVIPDYHVQNVWDTLLSQQIMTSESLDDNLATSSLAWKLAGTVKAAEKKLENVFGTDVALHLLEDEAGRRWIAKYIMNDPDCVL
ncbi:hypothetical protein ACHAWO_000534 [Cyclotella atomus]|uniref:Uncharacterized protein n=1 Tax=Cyclotella atomus TaxID=382360 RepID=A0ABD3P181_9STRA